MKFEIISNCCYALLIEHTDICSKCGEHCKTVNVTVEEAEKEYKAITEKVNKKRELHLKQPNLSKALISLRGLLKEAHKGLKLVPHIADKDLKDAIQDKFERIIDTAKITDEGIDALLLYITEILEKNSELNNKRP